MKTKKCNKCNVDRSHVYFETHNRSKDGLRLSCIICKKTKKCKRCEKPQPMGKYKYCQNKARRRERTCSDCHTQMNAKPSKYAHKRKIFVDIDRIKEIQKIMSVGIDPRKTQLYYMRREIPLETKQQRIR